MTVLIAGGGVAGAAAACLLGPAATLFEREGGAHDKVCGEFVSWEAQDLLTRLGLDLPALGGASIHAVRLVHGTRIASTRLPGHGLGLSRRVLDEALLALAARRGAQVIRGRAVRALRPDGLVLDDAAIVHGDAVWLATGKHMLRGTRRDGRDAPMVGFKMYYALDPEQRAALAGHVEVVLFPGGYAGLQMVEGDRANLCLLIRQDALQEIGASWSGVLAHLERHAPHLRRRLHRADALLDRAVTIARIPYGFVHAGDAGPRRLGDQMAVIPSFSGDGMAIALHTAFAAVATPTDYHARMRTDLSDQVGRAMVLHRAGQSHPGWVSAVARLWPGAMAWVARLTRVRPR